MRSSDLNFTFPFQKINQEKRVVTGIATANNVDLADDIVNFQASVEAFSNWIGNIREMHSPVAVGKLVDWKSVPVFHNGDVYEGIEVSVYISKGAEDTWQKILDGTLRGFSIGGMVQRREKKFVEKIGRYVQEILQYSLGELSVVDNPCNPAGMFAMIKSVDGKLEYVAENLQDVFYCEDDKYAVTGADSVCPACSEEMVIIGKVETFDNILINKLIHSYEDVMNKALSDINTVPTDAMAAEARRGLEWRREFNRGGTAIGVARARDIMSKDTLSISTVRRMHSFFSRHEVDKQGKGFTPGDGYPSAGRIAWALWGGDPGQTWARAITNRIKAMEKGVGTDVDGMTIDGPAEMSKAPAPPSDRVSGSERNKPGSASSGSGSIEVSAATGKALQRKADEHNEKMRDGDKPPWTRVTVGALKAVYRRGAGAFSTSHRPGMMRGQWAMARVNAYLYLSRNGRPKNAAYITDYDLLPSSHPKSSKTNKSVDTGQISEGGGGIKNPSQGNELDFIIDKMIVEEKGRFCVYSENRSRKFGCFKTLEEAQDRLVELEALDDDDDDDDNKNYDDMMSMSKATTKREDGEDFPAAAFAYVPDPESPSTWKLRLWDSLDEKETVAQVSRAVSALSPSGFRGNRVQIPAEDLASVEAKVRAAWRQVNGPDRELPAVLKIDNSNYLEDIIEKGGTDSMNLQENEFNDNINIMSEDFTETQKQSILSKMGDFIFGKAESTEKAQTIEVNTANGNFRVVTDGSMTNPPQVILNMVDVPFDNVEEKAGHMGMDEEMKSSGKDMVGKSEEADAEEATSDVVEKSESVDSVDEGEEMDFEKVLEGLSNLLDEKLEKVKAEITADIDGKIESIEKSVSEVKESAEEISSDLEKVANSGAEKKSADVEADIIEEEILEKSVDSEGFWGGIFVPVAVAKVLGYDS